MTTPLARSAYEGPDCGGGIFVSPFADAIPHPPTPEPPPDFHVEYVLPPSVPIGQTLKYKVRLTNVAGRDIAFTTCPGYSEGIKGESGFLMVRYLLNCQAVGLFRSGETVTFAMELRISAANYYDRLGPGFDMVGWWIDLPYRSDNKGGMITLTNPSVG